MEWMFQPKGSTEKIKLIPVEELSHDEQMWELSRQALETHAAGPHWRYLATRGRAVEVYEPWNSEPEGDIND